MARNGANTPYTASFISEKGFMKLTEHDIEEQLIALTQQLLIESGSPHSHRKITLNASLQRHLGIDSLSRAELFQRIEKQFSIQLSDKFIIEAETLKDIADAIYSATPMQKKHPRDQSKRTAHHLHVDLSAATTLIDVLVTYATEAPDRPHIYMLDDNGHEEIITYKKLFTQSLRVAGALLKHGLKPGDTVAIMQPTTPRFFYTFFGILLAGCVPVPIYPPLRPQQIEAYAKQEAKILRNAEVRLLVTFQQAEKISQLISAFVPSLKAVVTADMLLQNYDEAPVHAAKEDDSALIQYTSGSTSTPKGVLLTHQNLLANIRAFGQAVQLQPSDATVSWLPLYHDLGLIGFWLGSLYYSMPLNAMSPLVFLNRPEQWLWAIHHHRATISGAPNFAYELCVRRIDPASIEGLDLSSWRIAANGAEAIQPKTLARFTEKFAPYGFKAEAFLPVYGLAESTVGLATAPPGRAPWIDRIDRPAFEAKQQAILTTDEHGLEFVSCGPPLPGHEVRIVDDADQVLDERHIGYLQFRGPSNMQGYYNNPEATQAIYHDGWLDSGDMAYLADGEVFITGRKKDMIIKAGRNLYPTEIEELAAQVPGIRKGCVIAFGISDAQNGTEKLIVVAETTEASLQQREMLAEQITDTITTALDIAPDHVVLVAPRVIPKTSSGKLQRSACQKAYLEGRLAKHGLPTWLQISKLSIGWAAIKLWSAIAAIGKIFFTLYTALILIVTVIPLWILIQVLPRHLAAKLCRWWARLLFFVCFCRLRITGKDNLTSQNPVVYTANHSSYIDSLLLMAILPTTARFVGKQELVHAPIIRTFMQRLGYLAVDRLDASKGIENTQPIETALREGNSIMIFPEGTFTYAIGLRPFKLGAFKAAVDTMRPICPIAIQGTRQILRDCEYWLRPKTIHITIGTPLLPEGDDWQEMIRLKNLAHAEIAKHCGEPTLDLIAPGPHIK
jgi:fatty-acyl-CoA synthase